MRLLDLFCGAGGASEGYRRAGFRSIVGVDNRKRNYPFEFIRRDAMRVLDDEAFLRSFDLIHASPPCQRYSIACKNMGREQNHPDLLPAVRARLIQVGVPFVIENVPGAPLDCSVRLCASSFGLPMVRHRVFEIHPWEYTLVPPCAHDKLTVGVYGTGNPSWHRKKWGRNLVLEDCQRAMDIDWMSRRELSQAIPPAYTEWIGRHIIKRFWRDHEEPMHRGNDLQRSGALG